MVQPTGTAEGADDEPTAGESPGDDGVAPELDSSGRNRKRAVLYALPFFALGIGNATLILVWGIDPLWAFAQLPPILFTTALTYLVFSTDFLDNR
ncbi:hypothetical protein EGH24_11735 [Halonotius terrestris]|uniref:DUF8142 domain-containing protein n=1 Tax=Halonotius terrestris TaxID=2487750 RepID=A0A8J8P8G8_9EURY|nr:hypothetical protein [Halonotius terrestris]TQQ79295.1 hypothetical protein EGH24_11735 [Halonotius terrestris]